MEFKTLMTGVIALGLGLPLLAGCEDTVSKHEEVKVKEDGTVTTKTEKTVQESDGTIKKTEEKHVDKP